MSVLVLGASGLLGNAMFRVLSETGDQPVFGTIRDVGFRQFFIPELERQLLVASDLEDGRQLKELLDFVQPSVVVNCTALGKSSWQYPEKMISVFALMPRRLAHLCRIRGARFVQISSDGVFRGESGGYTENDLPDAIDSYGVAKILGEVECPGAVTLRTSIIGHQLQSKNGLLEWFLSQHQECTGHTRAIFSGFPTVVLAQVVRDFVLPNDSLHGIYHVASHPISKFDLLQLVAQKYGVSTHLVPDERVDINRSLCADRFKLVTGYTPPEWPVLIDRMHSYKFGLEGKRCLMTK